MTNDRKGVILSVIRANPFGNQLALSREVKARTGAGVSFQQLKKLRDAVGAGNYDAVFNSIAGGKTVPIVKRGSGRPRKVEAAPVSAQVVAKRGPGRPRKDGTAAQPREGKQRGDRRAKYDVRGRRGVDKNKVQLDEFCEHLVVCRTKDGLDQQSFNSRDRAQQRVGELLAQGYAATDIAYYRLNAIKTTVTVVVS